MDVPMYAAGSTARIEVDPSFLGDKVKAKTLKSAVIMYEANKRQGTRGTLNRGEVARSKKPMFRQKGLGRGRARHPQAPQFRGGGISGGPTPKDFSYRMPKKALRVALRSALLSKFRDAEVAIVDGFSLSSPKTKAVRGVLQQLGCAESCLIVSEGLDANLVLSARNLRRIKVMPVSDLNAFDVLFHRRLIFTKAALELLKETCGHE